MRTRGELCVPLQHSQWEKLLMMRMKNCKNKIWEFIVVKLVLTLMSNCCVLSFQCVCIENHHYMKLEKNKGVRGKVLEPQPWMEAKSWIKIQHSWEPFFPLSPTLPLSFPRPSNLLTQGEKNKMATQDLVAKILHSKSSLCRTKKEQSLPLAM